MLCVPCFKFYVLQFIAVKYVFGFDSGETFRTNKVRTLYGNALSMHDCDLHETELLKPINLGSTHGY